MKLSTRSRYGVRLMAALACAYGNKPVFLKNIASSEEISEKYLSLIVISLRTAGLVKSRRGARGGYSGKNPEEISLRNIIEALEGEIVLVECIKTILSATVHPPVHTKHMERSGEQDKRYFK